jgi:hypothetical protein
MHYKPCIEIIGGARALLPVEVCAYALGSVHAVERWRSKFSMENGINLDLGQDTGSLQ